ncbi:MAG TPA: helix-turn-helix domain-containing protein [Herpetosiphonaceae bacterium]
MTEATILLQELGFGDYEARAYVALLRRSPLNGYELAKASGIPRANIYAVLHKLEERGAVVRVDETTGARFAPVPATELVRRLGHRVQDALQAAHTALAAVSAPTEQAQIGTVRGYGALLEHARSLINATQERLLVAIWPDEARALAAPLVEAEARGVNVLTLCLTACPTPCGGCRGQIHPYRTVSTASRWLVLASDGAEVLAGEVGPREDTLAARTQQALLVELVSGYIRHSIALAAVLQDLGSHPDRVLGPNTQATLRALASGGRSYDWLQHLRLLLDEQA